MPPSQTRLTNFFATPPSKQPLKRSQPIFAIDSPSTSKRAKKTAVDYSSKQWVLDAGQKLLGSQHCTHCGMVFSIDCPSDVKAHSRFHDKVSDKAVFRLTRKQLDLYQQKYPGYVARMAARSIVAVTDETGKCSLKAKLVEVVEEIVNHDFGFAADISIFGRDGRCTLWAMIEDQGGYPFIGCVLVSELLKSAQWNDDNEVFENGPILGINRIWTHPSSRKKGLACQLIEYVRTRPTRWCKRIAFSDPTESGQQLARRISRKMDLGDRYLTYSVSK